MIYKEIKKIVRIVHHSLFSFLIAVSFILLMFVVSSILRGSFIGWHLSISFLTVFVVSLFFFYTTESSKDIKNSYIFLAGVILCVVIFWKEIIGLWQSTSGEIQTSVVNKSFNLFDNIVSAVIGGLVVASIMKKRLGNPKTK